VILPGGSFDRASAVIAMVAAVLLVTKKSEVIPVIVGSGAIGLALWGLGIYRAT
jgi:hypothetical protein